MTRYAHTIRRQWLTAENKRKQHRHLRRVRDLDHVPIRKVGVELVGFMEHVTERSDGNRCDGDRKRENDDNE